jgi:hypothetical protein
MMLERNLLIDYYDRLEAVIARCLASVPSTVEPTAFSPAFQLPPLDDALRQFLAPATAAWLPLGVYRGRTLQLLDLMRHPTTQTTKTYASCLMVARAVDHIRRTGERIAIFTPTSGNKGIALRDAVERAIAIGLVAPDALSIVTLAPASARAKFRSSRLSINPLLRDRNPALFYTGGAGDAVKGLLKQFAQDQADAFTAACGMRIWFSLDIRNYMIADAARAFLERDADATAPASGPRIHAHAVSSAFGLLGYNLGRDVLADDDQANASPHPGFLLVQHLDTPDMVLHALYRSADRARMPTYRHSDVTGLFEQRTNLHFPFETAGTSEVLDSTFYTRQPATSPAMSALVERFGGTGIVVSRHECASRYGQIRARLRDAGATVLPDSPGAVREWSLVMAMTGVLNAIDRDLVPDDADIVVHGSGCYADGDYAPIEDEACTSIRNMDDLVAALLSRRTDIVFQASS